MLENRFKMFLLEVTDGSPENHNEAYAKKESSRHPLNKLQTTTVDHESKFD